MTPTIALIAVSLIAAGLCVAVGIMQWRINQLKAENDRERARHEVTNELLTEARNEAKVENDLRRQAERNLENETDKAKYWEGLCNAWREEHRIEKKRAKEAEEALAKYSRQRDQKTGRFYSAKAKPSTLIETDGLTARIVPKTHTLRHGMTVKYPTPEEAKEIFEEAKRLGIKTYGTGLTKSAPWIWVNSEDGMGLMVGACIDNPLPEDIYMTASQFIAHMRGEDYALAAFDAMMGNAIEQLQGLTIR